MSATALTEPRAAAPTDGYESSATMGEADAEERGRLKRRRQSSVSPRRASSLSGGHERTSGSRYREEHGKHHGGSCPSSSISPPSLAQKKIRRRSDAEPDHTFRGRPRMRSVSRGRTRSPIVEGEDNTEDDVRMYRRRSQPPSRHKTEEDAEGVELRRQPSDRKCKGDRRDSKGDVTAGMDGLTRRRESNTGTE